MRVLGAVLAFIVCLGLIGFGLQTIDIKEQERGELNGFIRLGGSMPAETAALVSQYVYKDMPPHAIILVSSADDAYMEAMAASALIHHPRNGPILFTDALELPDITLQEILRLRTLSGNDTQVYVIGNISGTVISSLNETGMQLRFIKGNDPLETTYLIDKEIGFPDTIILVDESDKGAVAAAAWSAHAGTPILFIKNGALPESTLRALRETKNSTTFLIGNASSENIDESLKEAGVRFVYRVAGNTPAEISVRLASYKLGDFGWGRTFDGASSFTVISSGDWRDGIASALLGHAQGHAPILMTSPGTIDSPVSHYLDSINQPDTMVPDTAYIVGKGPGAEAELSLSDLLTGKKSPHKHHIL